MKLKKVLALILAVSITVCSFAGCSGATSSSSASGSTSTATTSASSTASTSATSTATTNSAYPGTSEADAITVNLATEPPDLNTLTGTYTIAYDIIRHIDVGLTVLDQNDNPQPGIAESWDISSDNLTYTFHLRKDAKWTNGDSVTANDFIFAWSKLIDPATASEYAYFGYDLFKNGKNFYDGKCTIDDVGFKATDDYTLVVTLETVTPYALFLFAFGNMMPINEKFYNSVGADNYNKDADKFCTDGPFKMSEWTHDSNIVLEKNDAYYDASKVSLKKITFAMLNDSTTALNSFKAGECDMVTLNGDQITQMTAEGYPMTDFNDGACFYVLYNCKDEYMSNVNLRRAINLAYSREDYVNAILKDRSSPAKCFCPAVNGYDGTSFSDAVIAELGELYPSKADATKAKEYLDKALSELGITLDQLNAHMSMNCGDSDTAKQQAEFFQEQLRTNLGIELQINSMTTKSQSESRQNRNYVIDFTGWGPDYNDPNSDLSLWVSNGTQNSADFSNADYDKYYKDAQTQTDAKARQEDFIQCEKIIADQLPVSVTYWRQRTYITSGKMASGFWRTTFQDMNFIYTKLN
jgi:oligopeptide transport system substrate-binding protein